MKFVTSDYVLDPTTHAKLGFQAQMGAYPHSGEIYTQSVYFFFPSIYIFGHLQRSRGRSYEYR